MNNVNGEKPYEDFLRKDLELKTSSLFDSKNEGLVDGALRLQQSEQHFDVFLEKYYEAIRLKEEIKEEEANLVLHRSELRKIEVAVPTLRGALAKLKVEIDCEGSLLNDLKTEKKRRDFSRSAKYEKVSNLSPEYGLFPSFLFLAVGVVLVATDLIVTHNIFQDLLNMHSVEAWFLGAGLALTSFGIKFVFDRFVEKPYIFSGKKRWLAIVSLILLLASIVMMGMAGYFRISALGEKEKIDMMMELNAGSGHDFVSNLDNSVFLEEIADLEQALYDEKSVLILFVLSSILFLLVGAICFSIAFFNLRIHAIKWVYWWPGRFFRWKEDISWRKKVEASEKRLAELKGGLEALQTNISATPNKISKYRELLVKKEELLKKLRKELSFTLFKMEEALYLSGYERGKHYELSSRPYISVARLMNLVFEFNSIGRRTYSGKHPPEKMKEPRIGSDRLYRRLRKKIVQNTFGR